MSGQFQPTRVRNFFFFDSATQTTQTGQNNFPPTCLVREIRTYSINALIRRRRLDRAVSLRLKDVYLSAGPIELFSEASFNVRKSFACFLSPSVAFPPTAPFQECAHAYSSTFLFVRICCRREDLQRDIMARVMAMMIGEDDGGAYAM